MEPHFADHHIRAQQVRTTIAILAGDELVQLLPLIDSITSTSDPLIIVEESGAAQRGDPLAGSTYRRLCVPKPARSGAMVMEAARESLRFGATHMLTISPAAVPDPLDLERLQTSIQQHSEAILIGTCTSTTPDESFSHRYDQWVTRMAFRIQTGISLENPRCGLRVYPLNSLNHLKLRMKGDIFHTEVLVKAAWAGIDIQQVAINTRAVPREARTRLREGILSRIGSVLLNLHWTMRSITPIPHRKIVSSHQHPGEKISVWHPVRSIKQLLTENTSPRQLAVAGAVGVLLGTLPLIAFHTIAILFTANYFRLNKIAALTTSQLCMPPIVPALCIEAGYYLRHGAFLTEVSLETLGYQALDRLFEWLIGSLVLAPVLAILVGGVIFLMAHILAKRQS